MASSNSKEKEEHDKKLFPLSTGAYLEQLHNLWTRKALCDAEVTADGRKFEVHRVVLAAASKYFERVFSSEAWVECRTGQVTLDGISALSLEIILNSVYTQELQLSPEIVLGVLEAAHRLEFSEVFKCCESYIEEIVAPPNCLDYLLAGETYNMTKVLQSSEKCLMDNFSIVSLQDKFLEMSGEALKNYIRSDSLQCESELDVFRAAVRWLMFDEERKEKATMLMRHVRFGLMGSSSLLGAVWKEPIMTSSVACQEMLRKAIEYCSRPNDQPFVKEEWCTPRNTKSWLVVIGGQWDHTRCMTPPVVVPFDDPRREIWSIDDNLKPFSNTYQDGGANVALNHYLYITGGVHTYPASSNDSMSEAHSSSNGRHTVSNAVWRFNSVELKCEQMTNMMVARRYHTAFIHKETIIVAGGKNDAKKSLSSTEIYTIKENSWELGPYLTGGLLLLAGCSHKDQAYISGGLAVKKHKEVSTKKFFKYDTILKDWIEKAPMIHERCEHVIGSTRVGIFVIGGRQVFRNKKDHYGTSGVHITYPEFYDTASNQWTLVKVDLRACKASAIVQNDKIYVLGGILYDDDRDHNYQRLASSKCFNTETKSVEKMSTKLPFRIEDAIMAILPLPSNKDDEEQQDRGDGDYDFDLRSDSTTNRNEERSRSNSPLSSSSYGGESYQYSYQEESDNYYSDDTTGSIRSERGSPESSDTDY